MMSTRSTQWWSAALTLAERAAALRIGSVTREHDHARGVGASRVDRWRSQRPFDSAEFLNRRLRIDDLTPEAFEAIVEARPHATANSEPPAWAHEVDRTDAVAHEIALLATPLRDSDTSGLAPVRAFVEPFVTTAMARLYGEGSAIVSAHRNAPFEAQTATALFEPLLWGHLIGRAMKVVILELNVARVRGTLVGDTPEARCASFASQLRGGPVRDQIIEEYPVLARALVTAAEYWVQSAREFLQYLAVDAAAIGDAFAGGELGKLVSLSGNEGDVHRHGRSVTIAGFSSGTRLVFKPRALDVDRHFNELIEWINARGQMPPLRAVRVLSMADHGWAEFVSNTPTASREEVSRFYERFGGFVAVLHVLSATDFHYENVIASGEFPMLIDLEALLHPLPERAGGVDEPEWLGWEALQQSVMRTGVLPFRAYDSEQSSGLDMSAVGGSGGQQTPNRFPVLVAAGTDEMRLERDFIKLPLSQNRPTLGGDPVEPIEFADRLLAGFASTYRLLLAHRDALVAPDGPLHRFSDDAIRVVLRPTRQYALILGETNHPDVLRDALDRDRLIDRLWVAVPSRPELEHVVRWEHADLVSGDVPLFTSRPASRDLHTTHGEVVPEFFLRSGLDSALQRIESMSEADLHRQHWIIQAAFVGLLPGTHDTAQVADVVREEPVRAPATPPSRDQILSAAARVAARLATLGLRQGDRVSWLGLTLVRERDWVIQPVGSDLYGGAAGIALFLAYHDHVVGNDESRALARVVVQQLTRRLESTLHSLDPSTPLPPASLGAFGALGGAIYTLAHAGALWSDHTLIDVAERLTSALVGHTDADRNLDIIGGTAGFVASVAALAHVRSSGALTAAIRHGTDVLLSRAHRGGEGLSWSSNLPSSQPLVGISHGASGMALALLAAGRILRHEKLVDAALEATRYERSHFDASVKNWPDFRILDGRTRVESPPWMWAWCHGAPGIGLARLTALGSESSVDLLGDLEAALESTSKAGFGGNDSLCHGDLGNLELLVRARELGHRGTWEETLAVQSARIVERVGRGEWRCGIPGGVETPGLMTGLAGVGYELLRLAAPEQVPSLLSLEAPRVTLGSRTDQ